MVALHDAPLLLPGDAAVADEGRVGRVIDRADGVGRHAQMSLHVAPGGFGNRDHALGAQQAAPEAVAPQVHMKGGDALFVEQVRHVVDGHHVGPDHEQGDAVQRDVHQIGREAPQENREGHVIQVTVIVAGINGRAEIRGQAGQQRCFHGTADQGVLVHAIDGGQGMDQAADIGPDAEIADAPGVDDDVQAHVAAAGLKPERGLASNCRAGTGR